MVLWVVRYSTFVLDKQVHAVGLALPHDLHLSRATAMKSALSNSENAVHGAAPIR
jgi:hypothetical protein